MSGADTWSLRSPAERLTMLLDDAIDAAGLGPQVTALDEKNGKLALALAVNWGARALLAYAVEARLRGTRGPRVRNDLAWTGALVRQATARTREHERPAGSRTRRRP
jgi:hypothetical protein